MTDLIAFAKTHAFVLISAIFIGATVRLLKEDTVFPITVKNKRLYAPISILLGLGAAAVDHFYFGNAWRTAILRGLFAGFLPVVGHDVVVKGALGAVLTRAGFKDVPVGKLLSIDPPSDPKPQPKPEPKPPITPDVKQQEVDVVITDATPDPSDEPTPKEPS